MWCSRSLGRDSQARERDTDNRLIYRDGVPVATRSAGTVDFLTTLDSASRWEAEKRLVRSAARGLLSHLG
jgi:ATP-dependent helicase Lhr and Lhr-like helicase